MTNAAELATAVRSLLIAEMPAYLRAVPLPDPTSYAQVPTREVVQRVNRVAASVSVPSIRLTDRRSNGQWSGEAIVGVAFWHEQADDLPLLTAASDYADCALRCLMQHQRLGGLCSQMSALSVSNDLIGDGTSGSTLGLGIVEVTAHLVLALDAGPRSRPTSPVPTVLTTRNTVIASEAQ